METVVQLFRSIKSPGTSRKHISGILDPELGFKLAVNEASRELKVTVIGARHLPTLYGLTRPEGYIVKVKLFPGKDKFETKMLKESWPIYNQDFIFELPSKSYRIQDQISGKFLVLTVYANLESAKQSEEATKTKLSSNSFKTFFKSPVLNLRRSESSRKSERVSLYKRRTVGAVTYNLDANAFTQKLRNNCLGTPDIWRTVKSISSGLVEHNKNTESNKGSIELTINYSISENGKNDRITLILSRVRFSIQTMETHEHYTGSLYVKMKVFECSVPVGKWKSDRFDPTISLKLEPTTATLNATVQNINLDAVHCEVILKCRNKLGKKTVLGQLTIGPKDGQMIQAIDMPGTPVTLWHNFK